MGDIAIKAENISKAYQLGEIGTGTISRDLERWWAKMRGKEDPYLKIGEANDRTIKGQSDIVWSLRDVSFEVKQGDAVGIIGRNGAGKSTLLKILSRVTSPTAGKISGMGRIASLLEVGTGFHPELTGRENIYLNGAILGMRKKEISRKFDEIVDFSGVERYVDTPVKRYSSGMYVRLAFAVAAHLESEILIVDEVLAVGDAEFQKKCLGKMGDVSKGEGRTILFVSHNMSSIRALCKKGILLNSGVIEDVGDISHVVNIYEQRVLADNTSHWINSIDGEDTNEVFLRSIMITDEKKIPRSQFLNSEEVHITFSLKVNHASEQVKVGFDIISQGQVVFRTQQVDALISDKFEKTPLEEVTCVLPSWLLNQGDYYLRPLLSIHNQKSLTKVYDTIMAFSISLDSTRTFFHSTLNETNQPGLFFPIFNWSKSSSF